MADAVPFQPDESVLEDDNHEQKPKTTVSSVLFKTMIGTWCLFLLFSVWFTLWTFIPVFVEALDSLAEQMGEGQQIPYMTALSRALYRKWQALSRIVVMTAADLFSRASISLSFMNPTLEVATKFIMGPLKELVLSILFVSAIYWFVFLSAKTYTYVGDGNPGATIWERMVSLFQSLWYSAKEDLHDFLVYIGIMLVCAFAFAGIFCLWPLSARLRGFPSHNLFVQPLTESCSYTQHSSMTSKDLWGWAMEEFGKLFKVHFLSSSFVAQILFNMGPLFDWWTPDDTAWVYFLTSSFALTAAVYPLVMVFFVGSHDF